MKLTSTNPSKNYEVIGEVEISTPEDVKAKVAAAHKAKRMWREMGLEKRISLLKKVAAKFEQDKERLAQLMSNEMGMPICEAQEEMESGLDYFNSYFKYAPDSLKTITTVDTDSELHQVYREPYGVAAVIVPWNFPFSNFVWQCGQNLVAGNTVVFKHSEETPLMGRAIEEIVCSILPEGVFSEVCGDGSIGKELVLQDVNLICFTGSANTGAAINSLAAPRFIHTVMELGGSAPGIVFEDADIDGVIDSIYLNRFMNNGQICDGLKRLIVHETRFEEVITKLKNLLTKKKISVAMNKDTDLGPLVAKRQLNLLKEQVQDALDKGAKVETGGKQPDNLEGAYYEPTILTGITKEMRVWQEEVFGPVLVVIPFKDEEQAIRMANDTKYGLGSYIFTEDKTLLDRVAAQLESGMVSHNNAAYLNVANPFGGYKMSGGGREHAQFGFDDVTQIKVVAKEK